MPHQGLFHSCLYLSLTACRSMDSGSSWRERPRYPSTTCHCQCLSSLACAFQHLCVEATSWTSAPQIGRSPWSVEAATIHQQWRWNWGACFAIWLVMAPPASQNPSPSQYLQRAHTASASTASREPPCISAICDKMAAPSPRGFQWQPRAISHRPAPTIGYPLLHIVCSNVSPGGRREWTIHYFELWAWLWLALSWCYRTTTPLKSSTLWWVPTILLSMYAHSNPHMWS